MKLDALVSKSTRLRKLNASLVRVVAYKTGRDKKGFASAVAKTYTPKEYNVHNRLVMSKDQNKYVSSVKFIDKKLNVKVSCSCPDYMFRWEYANMTVGASDIIYGNGEAPNVTNPELRPALCKHLIALRRLIKEKHNV